jgi:hypothetical protein
MMEVVSSLKKQSVNFYQTTKCNNPEDSHPLTFMLAAVRISNLTW